jgi:hypothetical protein
MPKVRRQGKTSSSSAHHHPTPPPTRRCAQCETAEQRAAHNRAACASFLTFGAEVGDEFCQRRKGYALHVLHLPAAAAGFLSMAPWFLHLSRRIPWQPASRYAGGGGQTWKIKALWAPCPVQTKSTCEARRSRRDRVTKNAPNNDMPARRPSSPELVRVAFGRRNARAAGPKRSPTPATGPPALTHGVRSSHHLMRTALAHSLVQPGWPSAPLLFVILRP